MTKLSWEERGKKLKADKKAKEKEKEKSMQEVKKELANVDYSKYQNLGMKNITAEDIRPPVMFLVQGNIDKTELVDQEGKECPDGSFYIKAFKEVVKTIEGYIIWVRKDHYAAPAENPSDSDVMWDGSRLYRAVFIRKDTMQPIAITFKKSAQSALSDLFTFHKAKNLPLFMIEVKIEAVSTKNKKGISYFKTVVSVVGPEKDTDILDKLFKLAEGFDVNDQVENSQVDEEAPVPTEDDLL